MASRMDRYKDEQEEVKVSSRTMRNKSLYDNLNTSSDYSELSGNFKAPVIEVSMVDNVKPTREDYHKIREYKSFMSEEDEEVKITKLDMEEEFNTPVEKKKSINEVLELAKQKRNDMDEAERKRKLRNADYNILANLTPDEVSDLKRKKEKEKADELQELINTITSNSLKNDIEGKIIEMKVTATATSIEADDGDLLSDLMPEDESETIISEEISKTILDKESEEETEEVVEENEIDNSFYTRSMDLSDKDFESDEEEDEDDFLESGNSFFNFFKIFVVILLLIALAVGVYFLVKTI